MKTYPLAELAPSKIRKAYGFKSVAQIDNNGKRAIRCVLTGEKRAPKKGEWYLSGARPAGWEAKNDLSTEYHIVHLVLTERIVTETIQVLSVGMGSELLQKVNRDSQRFTFKSSVPYKEVK